MHDIEKLIKEAGDIRFRLTQDTNIEKILNKLNESRINFSLDDEDPFSRVNDGSGVYFIEAKFKFNTKERLEKFGALWGLAKGKDLISNCPRFYKGRMRPNMHKLKTCEFVPFYLGKQQNVRQRLDLHLNDSIESTTYGLKLKARREILDACDFRVSWVTFSSTSNDYFCIELIEEALREVLNPLIGKQ